MRALPVFFTGPAEDDLDQIEGFIAAHGDDLSIGSKPRQALFRKNLQGRGVNHGWRTG